MSEYTLLPYSIILMAVEGDASAMGHVVENYNSYTARLAQREVVNENGDTVLIVDDEWKRRLELKLIAAVIKFKLY